MKRPARPRYPRIECSGPGCQRGSTIYEPGTRFICGKCWRRAPKAIRQQYSRWHRKGHALAKRGDHRADLCYARSNAAWERILHLLMEPELIEGSAIPPLMAEELRKLGLA